MVGLIGEISKAAYAHFDDYYESVHSHVYKEEFWNDYILECPNCSRNEEMQLNFESFLYSTQANIIRITPDAYKEIMNTGTYTCNNCGKTFYFREGYYSIWWPIRKNKRTGPNGEVVQQKKMLVLCVGLIML